MNSGIYESDYDDSDHDDRNDRNDRDENVDTESLSEELSPTDGYFSQRNHPQDLYVQPSNTTSAEASSSKAQEAAEERQQHEAESERPLTLEAEEQPSSSSQQSPRTALRRITSWSEVTPLVEREPPPPAYEAATRDRHYGEGHSQAGYGTVDDGARAPLLGGNVFRDGMPPQSMGGDMDVESGAGSGERKWDGWVRRGAPVIRRVIKVVAGIVVFVVLAVVFSASTFREPKHDDSNPVLIRPEPDRGVNLPAHCRVDGLQSAGEMTLYEFNDITDFSLLEFVEQDENLLGGIYGDISVSSAWKDQTADIVVALDMRTTSTLKIETPHVVRTKEGLVINTPSYKKGRLSPLLKPCLSIQASVFVKPEVNLSNLEITSANLNLRFASDFHSFISNQTELTLVYGSLSAANLASRETKIDVRDSPVDGRYSLYDLLSVRTRSGSVSISVDPKPVNKDAPKPALFSCVTRDGSVDVDMPVVGFGDEIPDREYQVRTETSSGRVSGSFIHGSATRITTNSGQISARVLPFAGGEEASSFVTSTSSGSQDVRILEPFKNPTSAIRNMRSSHSSNSGSLNLYYPGQWEGSLSLSSRSGSLNVDADDLEDVERGHRGSINYVKAKRGKGGSSLKADTSSGSITVHIA